MGAEPSGMGLVLLRDPRKTPLALSLCEDMVRRQLSMKQALTRHVDLGLLSLQYHEE